MLPLIIEKWNDAYFRFLVLPAQKLGFLILKKKE
jgi:hypothetical protein